MSFWRTSLTLVALSFGVVPSSKRDSIPRKVDLAFLHQRRPHLSKKCLSLSVSPCASVGYPSRRALIEAPAPGYPSRAASARCAALRGNALIEATAITLSWSRSGRRVVLPSRWRPHRSDVTYRVARRINTASCAALRGSALIQTRSDRAAGAAPSSKRQVRHDVETFGNEIALPFGATPSSKRHRRAGPRNPRDRALRCPSLRRTHRSHSGCTFGR